MPFRYRPTLLNGAATTTLVGCIIYTIIKYPVLSEGEGWGMVAMIGLFGLALTAYIPDIIIQNLVKNRILELILDLLVIICYFLFIHYG